MKELKFNVNGGISKLEVDDDCYVDELFATLQNLDTSVSDEELHQIMRSSNAGLVCESTGQTINFRDYANSNQTINDLGISTDTVYKFSNTIASTHDNG